MSAWTIAGLTSDAGPFHLGPVDLDLGPTESVAILGRSGAGKTTLLRGLAGLGTVSGGRIHRGDEETTRLPPEHRSAVYVPQGLGLFPHRTVRRNVAYPLEISGAEDVDGRTDQLLERFGLGALSARWPTTLSSGEQQRVAIARALAAGPELLLWDEPLGALDLLAREELLEGLREVRSEESIPLLFVTHDPALALSLADRWLVLEAGRVVYLGRPAPLISAPPDRFLARFVGFENLFAPADLTASPRGPFREALTRRLGSDGVGVGTPRAHGGRSGDDEFEARVERVEPSADGFRVEANCEGLDLTLGCDADADPTPRPGDRLFFSLAGVRQAPIGGPFLDGRGSR